MSNRDLTMAAYDLCVAVALERAPKTEFAAVTIEFISLLRCAGFVWHPRGIYRRSDIDNASDKHQPGAFPSYLFVFAVPKMGKQVWWVGDGSCESAR